MAQGRRLNHLLTQTFWPLADVRALWQDLPTSAVLNLRMIEMSQLQNYRELDFYNVNCTMCSQPCRDPTANSPELAQANFSEVQNPRELHFSNVNFLMHCWRSGVPTAELS